LAKSMMSAIFVGIVAIVLPVIMIHFLPTILHPVLWTNPNPLPQLVGKLSPNSLLQNPVKVVADFAGAEAFAVDTVTGNVYAGMNDGTVAMFSKDYRYLQRIFFTGGFISQSLSSQKNGIDSTTDILRGLCNTEALAHRLAWNKEQERTCGRPLGIRFVKIGDKGSLYIFDAYHGLFQLDLATNIAKHIITPTTTITLPADQSEIDPTVSMTPLFYNDLDTLSNGDIIFTDSSTKFTRSENRPEILDSAGRGRLFRYSPKTKQLNVLLCGLHFPNGVQVIATQPGNEVIVAELTRFRILRVNTDIPFIGGHDSIYSRDRKSFHALSSCSEYGSLFQALNLSQPMVTGISIFADSVPGLADNIRVDQYTQRGGPYFLVGLGGKSAQPFSLLWMAFPNHWLRYIAGRLIPMKYIEKLVPRYGLVVVYDQDGKVVASLHDPTGNVAYICKRLLEISI